MRRPLAIGCLPARPRHRVLLAGQDLSTITTAEIPFLRRQIGVGEGIDDLREFRADDFVRALFSEKEPG